MEIVYDEDYEPVPARPDEEPAPDEQDKTEQTIIEAANAARRAYESAVKTAQAAELEIDSDGYAHLPAELDDQADPMQLQALIESIKASKAAWDAAIKQAEALGVEIVYDEDYEPAPARPDEVADPDELEMAEQARIKAEAAMAAAKAAAEQQGIEIDWDAIMNARAIAAGEPDLEDPNVIEALAKAEAALAAAKKAAEEQGIEIDWDAILKLPALPAEQPCEHDYADVVTAPTCTEGGYTTYTCSKCGDSYQGDETEAQGHDFQDGVCTRCGAENPDYVPPVVDPFRFDDVKDDKAFYFAPVYWAVEQKITKGTSEKLFSPDAGCTRGQVVTFLWRAAGEPEPAGTKNPFRDIKETDYFYKAVAWAVEKGITKGISADKFSPDATCTRAQIVTFLYRAEGTPEIAKKSKPFTDVDPAQYYADAVAWAVEHGITTGKSPETFAPNATCTRGEIVTFLYRSYTGSKPQNPDTAGGPPVYYTASSVEELTQWIKTAEVEPSYNWGSLYPFLKAARDLGQILAVYPASEDYSLQEILVQCNREQMDYFFVKGNERLEVLVELPGTDSNPKLSLYERIGQINSDLALEYESLQYAKASATVNGKETDVYYYDGGEYTKIGSEQKELFGPSAFFEYEGHVVLIRGIGSLYGCKWDSTYLDLFQFDFVELE